MAKFYLVRDEDQESGIRIKNAARLSISESDNAKCLTHGALRHVP